MTIAAVLAKMAEFCKYLLEVRWQLRDKPLELLDVLHVQRYSVCLDLHGATQS